MTEYTTIKVSKKTLQNLRKFVGKMTEKTGRRTSMEEAINFLLNEYKISERHSPEFMKKLKEDRERFIKVMEHKIEGAGPDDYKEYNFEDI